MGGDVKAERTKDATDSGAARAKDDLHVVILAGGLSHERDVSLRSGRRVAESLRETGVRVTVRDVDSRLLPLLAEERPDVVWPLLHGSTGEDGSIRSLLELLELPYVGSDAAASRVASRKPVAKGLVADAGLATPGSVALPQSLFRELGAQGVLDAVLGSLGLPLVVKPADGGSALGVTFVRSAAELPGAMVACFAYGDLALIERAVTGTEVAVSVVDLGDGPRALPPVEIVTDGPYDYDARYNPGRTEYFVPARLDEEQCRTVCEAAVTAHRALGLRDLSRTDMILDDEGTAWFIDMNVAPGMTETSLFPQAALAEAGAGGMGVAELYRALVVRAAGA
ncbi:D-alanine--D-alanine ligase family protein [Georgenia faecalis]|uniref:D-alanine--D-alanine ligase n=1 Tax=Georgenia faecalis TaxID=2483799 RepID=A0ABV9D7T8_9MICO|nr:D-alanine--D-alanine ligase [Georgenia faecalis]